jgi:hypothetical protein
VPPLRLVSITADIAVMHKTDRQLQTWLARHNGRFCRYAVPRCPA